MNHIRLLGVENIISRKQHRHQRLTFFMRVDNLSYHKDVNVIWAGEDQVWHTQPAHFHSASNDGSEFWLAQVLCYPSATQALAGNIQFSLRYQSPTAEYLDNNHGNFYHSQADSGIKLAEAVALQNWLFTPKLADGQKFVPITIAINQAIAADKVTIHWTLDNWQHNTTTPCHYQRHYWDKSQLSNARNPNQYGVTVWKTWLNVRSAFRLQYCIAYEVDGQLLWDNNNGGNYVLTRKALNVMILNLHCYQEDNQHAKFTTIARAIDDLAVDVVCLQEVAELWNDGHGDWQSNAARIINDQLNTPYHLYTDWSHLGFDRYREGLAILSRYPLHHTSSRYVSNSHDAYSIHARKVVMAQINVPYMGLINVFSAHLSWWEDGFANQFNCLRDWANSKQDSNTSATLLCGDFNVAVGSQGYQLALEGDEFVDQYLAAKTYQPPERNFRTQDPYWQHYASDDYRIDYIFMNRTSALRVSAARRLFTEHDYGQVSDHCGYLMTFEPK